ncbi:MAG: response regulator [Thermodesulfovibrionales bacterium]|jgi:DNA-binding NtrC family response regulator
MAILLVVDDDPLQRNILKVILSDEGYETHVASSGDEALRIAKTLEPDVVLTDLWMGDMDGMELMKKLRSQVYTPEIIIMSAFGGILPIMEAVGKGECRYIEKPLEKDNILLSIKQALERHRKISKSEDLKD